MIPGITYAHGAFTSPDNSRAAQVYPPGSWQAQGGAGGIYGQGHLPIAEQPQLVAPVSTAHAIALIGGSIWGDDDGDWTD